MKTELERHGAGRNSLEPLHCSGHPEQGIFSAFHNDKIVMLYAADARNAQLGL